MDRLSLLNMGVLTAASIVFLGLLVHAQLSKDPFDLRTLVAEDGKLSIHKLGQMIALLVSTWAFIHQVLNNSMTETLYMIYMGVWASAEAVNQVINRRKD